MAEKRKRVELSLWRITDFERVFERLYSMGPGISGAFRQSFTPATDVFEIDDTIIFKIDLAGVDKESLKIEIEDRTLTVQGHRLDECEEQRMYYQVEIEFGHFRRIFDLPFNVKSDSAKAVYENGFLSIIIEKADFESDTVKVIEIS